MREGAKSGRAALSALDVGWSALSNSAKEPSVAPCPLTPPTDAGLVRFCSASVLAPRRCCSAAGLSAAAYRSSTSSQPIGATLTSYASPSASPSSIPNRKRHMSSTSATSATYAGGGGVFGTLSRIGRSLMLPIAVLPAATLLLRFGQDDLLGKDGRIADLTDVAGVNVAALLASAGSIIFANLPLLFAVGIAIGFGRRSDGSTALAAVVGWLVFNEVFNGMVADNPIRILP